ncbi:hypothetical protein Fmac_018642 [Flemingia macrophylla]|uniref:Hexosyltransferase n=1 Tax=Flemingia macrophylla TaxID=520843 RepID=A0ABD1M5L7_9FABA
MLNTTYLHSSMAAILSILQHSSYPQNILFHFLSVGSRSSSSTDASASFPFLKFQIYPFYESVVAGLILTFIHSALDCPLNYSRNYMATILPSCIRTVVYLNSDLVLVDDIAKLATTSLRDHVLAVPKYCNANFIAYFTLSFWSNPLLSLTFAGCRCKPYPGVDRLPKENVTVPFGFRREHCPYGSQLDLTPAWRGQLSLAKRGSRTIVFTITALLALLVMVLMGMVLVLVFMVLVVLATKSFQSEHAIKRTFVIGSVVVGGAAGFALVAALCVAIHQRTTDTPCDGWQFVGLIIKADGDK